MAHQVNLDALIPREDFDVDDSGAPSQQSATVQIRNLELNDFFYNVLRKPDFQRETSDWAPDKIGAFVQSFLDGDLIPALILWQRGTQIFVIDGAHRLSALVAWSASRPGFSRCWTGSGGSGCSRAPACTALAVGFGCPAFVFVLGILLGLVAIRPTAPPFGSLPDHIAIACA